MEGNEVEEKIVGDLDWDGLHRPRIYYAVATTFCGLFLSVLDGSICNVALPSIARELGVSSSDSIWIVNAFQLVIMMTILPFASMGERGGYKQVYRGGVSVLNAARGWAFLVLSRQTPPGPPMQKNGGALPPGQTQEGSALSQEVWERI